MFIGFNILFYIGYRNVGKKSYRCISSFFALFNSLLVYDHENIVYIKSTVLLRMYKPWLSECLGVKIVDRGFCCSKITQPQ